MRIYTVAAVILTTTIAAAQQVPPSPNGIEFPQDYQDWALVSVSERTDNNTLRAILGNDAAIKAMRAGNTAPWPDGSVLAKIVYNQGNHQDWDTAVVPTEIRHVEFMVKDSARFAETGGWGFARWLGVEKTPFGENAEFAQECFACHTPVESRDFVFTEPVLLP